MNSNLKKVILFVAMFALAGGAAVNARAFVRNDLPKFVATDDERFNKLFREGRDLIEREDWRKAADKFNEITCDCPEKQYVDAAFYWLAFCYKKMNRVAEMNRTVERLLKNFPNSSWADDARILQIETRAVSSTSPTAVFPGSGTYTVAGTSVLATTPARQLDREDEIRLAAFQSLYAADPRRAIEVLSDMLKGGSKASESLKREILRSLRNRNFWSRERSSVNLEYPAESEVKSKNEDVGPLREVLMRGFETETSNKVKGEILVIISSFGDDQSIDFLMKTYRSESDKEVKKSVINALALSGGFSYSFAPMSTSGNVVVAGVGAGQSRSVVSVGGDETKSARFGKLLEIFRTENDPELKGYVLSKLQTFRGWSKAEGIVDGLVDQYDSESNETMKLSIISSFAGLGESERATRKLLDIAKNDKSDKLRLAAIRSLRGSKNPEVLKFLEELIK